MMEKIKELRAQTGAGFMDCKRALAQTNGELAKAVDLLREKGLAAAAKKSGRITAEGVVGSYIHGNGKIGVLVEINCETDFVAKNKDFLALVHDVCMHVAASNPKYIAKEEVEPETIEHERQILLKQAVNEGKNPDVAAKIVAGRLEKYYAENCLLEQPFVKDSAISVGQLIQQKVAQFGENIGLRRFARFEMGEGLEKRQEDYGAEIARLQGK